MDPNVPAVDGIVIVQVFHFDILWGCSQDLESEKKKEYGLHHLPSLLTSNRLLQGGKSIRRGSQRP